MSLSKMKYEELNLMQYKLMLAYSSAQQKIQSAQKEIEQIQIQQRDLGAELAGRAEALAKKKEIAAEKLRQAEIRKAQLAEKRNAKSLNK